MVIPRSRSSGALSIWSNATNSASPFFAWILVIAAVSVVFPWSTCPIVPTFTCGFVRSNFCLAIGEAPGYGCGGRDCGAAWYRLLDAGIVFDRARALLERVTTARAGIPG